MSQRIIYSNQDGKRHVSYTFDDHPVVHTELDGPKAELARKYQFAIKELELATSYLNEISETLLPYIQQAPRSKADRFIKLERRDELVTQGLFAAATVAYGKLFMGVGQGRKQFQPREFFAKEGKRFEELHSWWMDVRNEYIAHSAGTPYDDARIVLLLPPPFEVQSEWFWCFPHVRFHRLPDPWAISDLFEMTTFMLSLMRGRQDRLIQHIVDNLNRAQIAAHRRSAVYASPCHDLPQSPPLSE